MDASCIAWIGLSLVLGFGYGFSCATKFYRNNKFAKIIHHPNSNQTIFKFDNGQKIFVPSMTFPIGGHVNLVMSNGERINCPQIQHPKFRDILLVFPPGIFQTHEQYHNVDYEWHQSDGTKIEGQATKNWNDIQTRNTTNMFSCFEGRESTLSRSRPKNLPTE